MPDDVPCRGCGAPLRPGGERRIGVCVECIAKSSQVTTALSVPRYGAHDGD